MFASVVNGDDMKTKNSLMITLLQGWTWTMFENSYSITCIVYAMLADFHITRSLLVSFFSP